MCGEAGAKLKKNMTTQIANFKIFKIFDLLIYILVTLFFAFNLMGIPEIKFVYLGMLCITGYYIYVRGWRDSVHLIIILSFIEGQGRILWEYNTFFRLVFDLFLILAYLLYTIKSKNVFPNHLFPNYFSILIIFHFLIYFVELFNTDSVGFVGVLAAAKIYIVPLLLFFMFLTNPITEDKILKKVFWTLIAFFCIEAIISFYQMGQGEKLLLSINSYYKNPLRGEQFIGDNFRPFGTGFNAGGYSVLYYLSVGLLFLVPLNWKEALLRNITLLIGAGALILSQVRSAFLKYSVIILLITGFLFLIQKNRFKTLMVFGLSLFGVITFLTTFNLLDKVDFDLTRTIERFESLSDVNSLKSQRISFEQFYLIISNKLSENPMGLGPGRTGAANTINLDVIAKDQLYGIEHSWASDNLLISLAIDFGFGMIFYVLIVVLIPIKLFFHAISNLKKRNEKSYRILITSAISTFVIILGNWGAIGLPYNPESFYFWLWSALGWSEIYKGNRL